MRRKLILLNLVLIAAVSGLGWRLRRDWQEAEAHRLTVAAQRVKPVALPAPPVTPLVAPVTSPQYSEVAQKMLFARDRNPNVILDVAPPKPMPALPVSHGFVDFGGDPTVLLSEKTGSPTKAYHPADKIGEFQIVSVNRDEIVFNWDGKEVKRKLEELSARNQKDAQQEQQQAASAPGAPPPAASATTIASTVPPGPGKLMGDGVYFCQPGDNSPDGTVVNGLKKMSVRTPFGQRCRWDPVN